MYCYNCGKKIDDEAKFCKHCGAKQDKEIEDKQQSQIVNIEDSGADKISENLDSFSSDSHFNPIDIFIQIKEKVICFYKDRKRLYYSIAGIFIILLVLCTCICLFAIHAYNSAVNYAKKGQYDVAYNKINYTYNILPKYKDTKLLFEKYRFSSYYRKGLNSELGLEEQEKYLKKASSVLTWVISKENPNISKELDGFIYNVWYRKAINMADVDFQQGKLSYAISHINEAENYLSLAKEKLLPSNNANEKLKEYFNSQTQYTNELKASINASKKTIMNLHYHMKIAKDDFEKTLQIYDKYVNDAFWGYQDFIFLDLVQYESDSKPQLYLMVVNKGNKMYAKGLKFNIDGNITTKTLTTPYSDLFEKYQMSCDEVLIQDILKAKNVRLKLYGSNDYKVRTLTTSEIQAIKRTYDYYRLFAKDGNVEERIRELQQSNFSDRYVKANIPNKYLADQQNPNSEFAYTIRYDLFNLYKFQKMSPNKRVTEFEEQGLYTISDILTGLVNINQVYKVANDYCIRGIEVGSGIEKHIVMEHTACTNSTIGIETLPYKKCLWFSREDKDGEYYLNYDVEGLWKEFDRRGIANIESDINVEINKYFEQHPQYAPTGY